MKKTMILTGIAALFLTACQTQEIRIHGKAEGKPDKVYATSGTRGSGVSEQGDGQDYLVGSWSIVNAKETCGGSENVKAVRIKLPLFGYYRTAEVFCVK